MQESTEGAKLNKKEILIGLMRISIGFIFLWAFLDKLFGLGLSTAADQSWLKGVSPVFGFLKFGTHGYFAGLFQSAAGNAAINWLYMLGMLSVGIALILGIGVKIASVAGSVMMFLIWLAVFPPTNNPFIDEHIIYILLLIYLGLADSGRCIGFGKWWSNREIVKKFTFLK